jgi:hypothetical protein
MPQCAIVRRAASGAPRRQATRSPVKPIARRRRVSCGSKTTARTRPLSACVLHGGDGGIACQAGHATSAYSASDTPRVAALRKVPFASSTGRWRAAAKLHPRHEESRLARPRSSRGSRPLRYAEDTFFHACSTRVRGTSRSPIARCAMRQIANETRQKEPSPASLRRAKPPVSLWPSNYLFARRRVAQRRPPTSLPLF